jgi:transcriptional regulator with XRE-family HTH domain
MFRALLRELRVQQGLTQAELGEKLGRTQTYVSKFETGERRLDFVETAFVCDALGTTIDELAARFTERRRIRGRHRA